MCVCVCRLVLLVFDLFFRFVFLVKSAFVMQFVFALTDSCNLDKNVHAKLEEVFDTISDASLVSAHLKANPRCSALNPDEFE